MKKIILLPLLFVFLFVGHVNAVEFIETITNDHYTFDIYQVQNDDRWDVYPVVSNGGFVWKGGYNSGGDDEVLLFNGTTIINVSNNTTSNEFEPCYDGSSTFWRTYTTSNGSTTGYIYNQNWTQIAAYNTGSFTVSTGYPPSFHSLAPTCSNGQVTWAAFDGDDYEIFLWNGTTTQITDNSINDYEPQINSGRISFTAHDTVANTMNIHLYANGTITALTNGTASGYIAQDSDIYENKVVWAQFGYFPSWTSQIFCYDGSSTVQISSTAYQNNFEPSVSGNKIAWSNFDGNDYEIMVYNGIETTQLTNNSVHDYEVSIEGSLMAWMSYDASNTTEIFYANISEVLQSSTDSWKNFYGQIWYGAGAVECSNGISYCKNMGYDYLALRATQLNKDRYLANSDRDGLKFYIINPKELQGMAPVDPYMRIIIPNVGTMSQSAINHYNDKFAWIAGTTTFPHNLAAGWWEDNGTKFRPIWDLQQQSVIDYLIPQIIDMIQGYEVGTPSFSFAGFIYDIPTLSGEINYWNGTTSSNEAKTFDYWNGTDSSLLHGTITHEYSTYTDANAAFYKQLHEAVIELYPDHKVIHEPWTLWSSGTATGWVNIVEDRSDWQEIVGDMLLQESAGVEFVTDSRNFAPPINFSRQNVGSAQVFKVEQELNRLYASAAGTNTAWLNYFGTWGNRGTMPNFATLQDVYPRLKFIRCIPNWDNLNGISFTTRSSVNDEYSSTHKTIQNNTVNWSHIGTYTMYSRSWKDPNKIFIVKMGTNTELYEPVVLHKNEKVKAIYSVDGLFGMVSNVKETQWERSGSSWNVLPDIVTGTNTDGGVGFIMDIEMYRSLGQGSSTNRNYSVGDVTVRNRTE